MEHQRNFSSEDDGNGLSSDSNRREGATLLFSITILDRLITASVTSHSNEERFAWLAPAISVGTPLR